MLAAFGAPSLSLFRFFFLLVHGSILCYNARLGVSCGFTGLGVAARPAHFSQMGGFGRKGDRERTGRQGMAGRASGARCMVPWW
ncbi:hypothetical protein BDP55DRAFT_284952 [Colletotrichum godetiae]|uniref:Secreted protein n=1 Tax=Colletotrichum godetiae TaxID=1209918 RepID=A0AAJ0AG79_9PEZI|nr:uncharacterized protein BDP55DRAFT_284952 [Colletotrichum godetiae]KAK1671878.1 hypothetical protein BDP55DRAFT_284952 [Colletotrichum godetiae]